MIVKLRVDPDIVSALLQEHEVEVSLRELGVQIRRKYLCACIGGERRPSKERNRTGEMLVKGRLGD